MKLISFAFLSLILSAVSHGADLAPNTLEALAPRRHLDPKPLAFSNYRLGLAFTEANRFAIDPKTETTRASKVIKRQVSLAVGLPYQIEAGISLKDTQSGLSPEENETFATLTHHTRPLGGSIWSRWVWLASPGLNLAATAQYEPGLANKDSFLQASQDRTSLGFAISLHPLSWLRASSFAAYSYRKEEVFREYRLGDEGQLGLSLTLGSEFFGVYGESLNRQLQILTGENKLPSRLQAREHKLGLYLSFDAADLSVFTIIPDTHRYPGVPERAIGASLTMKIGASVAPAQSNKDSSHASNASKAKQNAPIEIIIEPLPKILESNEPDEFQLLDSRHEQEVKRGQSDSPTEIAERALREQVYTEAKLKSQIVAQKDLEKIKASERLKQRIDYDDRQAIKYKDEIDQEVNRYNLPDQEELDWNGLQH